jgi:hypothetical protein
MLGPKFRIGVDGGVGGFGGETVTPVDDGLGGFDAKPSLRSLAQHNGNLC